ncbi:RloB family protein [Devriesea agamarum]|uniref:RloB family protein n=1 Tax=Devriesea agamarum TaxID=472569 RepID=UPI00071C527D|nr:RloB family protein [Devriesea agamarum]
MAGRQRRRNTRPHRQPVRRILVVTEGTRTEPQYVEGLNRYLRSKGVTTCVKPVPVGRDPLKVVQRCVEKRDEAAQNDKEYDDCVCLVDVDEHQTLPAAIQLAQREGIWLLISNLKFEAWLRWHVEDKRSALTSTQLDELVTKLGLIEGKILSHSFPFHRVHEACKTARAIDPELKAGRKGPDPSSAMPILVELMEGKASRHEEKPPEVVL